MISRMVNVVLILTLMLPSGVGAMVLPEVMAEPGHHHHLATPKHASMQAEEHQSVADLHHCCPSEHADPQHHHHCPPGGCPCACGCEISALIGVDIKPAATTSANYHQQHFKVIPTTPARLLRPPRTV